MKEDKLSILEELLDESLQEKKGINDVIQKNLNRIAEIDSFINSIKNNEETDFKVFSPRSAESIHREELAKVEEEKKQLENSNDYYYRKLGKAESRIEKISSLIKDEKDRDITDDMQMTILSIQEKERSRIAKELHDSSLQNLAHLVHSIELGSLFIDQDPVRAKLELTSCSENLKKIINDIRDTIFNLRPMSFDDLGFKQCIDNLIDNFKKQYKEFIFICDIDDISTKSEFHEKNEKLNLLLVSIYRVIQEAMINAVKYSEGNKVELSVKENNHILTVKIVDDGKGFYPEETADKHFGISIMQERIFLLGGNFEINSKPDQGTRIYFTVPLL